MNIARLFILEAAVMVIFGVAVGLTLGVLSIPYVEGLLYNVRATDIKMLAIPLLVLSTTALLAAVPPTVRAIRIDPVGTLRAE
jgi:ABC-type lipoprotein release transport system permease subunit